MTDEPEFDDRPDFGPCCCCGGMENVRSIIMLDYEGVEPGKGWGCVQCGLPVDGASYVACDYCVDAKREPVAACVGYLTEKRREPIAAVYARGPHNHDLSLHPEVAANA